MRIDDQHMTTTNRQAETIETAAPGVRPRSAAMTRRDALLGTAALAAIGPWLGMGAPAAQAASRVTWRDAVAVLLGDVQPVLGRISLDIPQFVEGGAAVPFTVRVASPMTDADFVRSVHVFASQNPRPDVASFFFTPLSGRAQASSRVRLWGSQELIAIAEMSDGRAFLGRRPVQITPNAFASASGEPGAAAPEPEPLPQP